jgi:hypothetical protein
MATKSNLESAKIYAVTENGMSKLPGTQIVECMFNPHEYTVAKTNTFNEQHKNNARAPQAENNMCGSQTLSLNLTFDTYESGEDVTQTTRQLWKFMEPWESEEGGKPKKNPPPQVVFEWGVFYFVAHITTMSQQFTLFKPDGTPVRAKVTLTFKQYTDREDYEPQNPTSGGGPAERIWQVVAGDRLDTIAAEVYDDPARWRTIAEHNRLSNPLALRPGTRLRLPLE